MPSLSSLKKKELVQLATDLNLETDGLKNDLEARIGQYLAENENSLINKPHLAPFYNSIIASPGPTASVGRRKSIKTPIHAREIIVSPSSEASDSTDEDDGVGALVPVPEGTRGSQLVSFVADPISGISRISSYSTQVVSHRVNASTNSFFKYSHKARTNLSTVFAIIRLEALYEFAIILKELIPFTVRVSRLSIPYGPSIRIGQFYLPDWHLFLKYDAFWQPLLFWSFYFVILPTIVAYFFNFTIVKSSNARARHVLDPVTFTIAKAFLTYLLFIKLSVTRESIVTDTTAITASRFVEPAVPFHEAQPLIKTVLDNTAYVGGAITIAFAIYSAILL
ncbi:hypothetical protein V1514DRAFT_361678 [Lipomyces japonicus]|uniref:uncharacterized protein n=1 Tax=Lipomyces japonicus TaxID=56871 RepID=UPI0034CE60C7